MRKCKLLFICLSTLSLLLSGCCKKKETSNDSGEEEKTQIVLEQTVGTSGGVISDDKGIVEINVPAGALDKDTKITVEYLPDADNISDNPQFNYLCGVKFGPSGTSFAKPVEVSLKVNETPKSSSLTAFYYEDEYECWNYVADSSIKNGKATFSVTHFSMYQVLDITPDMYMKFVDLVYDAVLNKRSDSWITEQYKEYLIDEKHVMDYYQKSNGYYYEPCGLFVYGKYYIDGKDGDQEALSIRVGESNKVGNRYGLSTVVGLLSA